MARWCGKQSEREDQEDSITGAVEGVMTISTTIPHSDFGYPSCCGCLVAVVRDDLTVISCNECGAVVGTRARVPRSAHLRRDGILARPCESLDATAER